MIPHPEGNALAGQLMEPRQHIAWKIIFYGGLSSASIKKRPPGAQAVIVIPAILIHIQHGNN